VVTKGFGNFWGEKLECKSKNIVENSAKFSILTKLREKKKKKKATNGYKKLFSCYQFHLLGKFEIFCHFHSIFIFIYMV
jgi:hypothetical protein